MAKVAIIFGATGIVGSAITEQLTNTSPQEWEKIIITSRREPVLSKKDPRVTFVSLDLEASSEDEIKQKLKQAGGQSITHVFYTAYIHDKKWDGKKLCERNTPMFKKAITSVDGIASGLQRVMLQLGMKYYGIHMHEWRGKYPIDETNPRHEDDPNNPDFYYEQEDFLIEFQKGKKWDYTTTRPNHIIGVTRGNGMSVAPTAALYFLIQKQLGKKATFPGTQVAFKGISDTSNADLIAGFTILASTHPEASKQAFNIIDNNNTHQTWEEQWKSMGTYFNVEIEGPTNSNSTSPSFSVEEYMKDKKDVWLEYVKKNGGDEKLWDFATWDFLDAITSLKWNNGPYDLSKAQKLGWKEEKTASESFAYVFDKLKKFEMIPDKL